MSDYSNPIAVFRNCPNSLGLLESNFTKDLTSISFTKSYSPLCVCVCVCVCVRACTCNMYASMEGLGLLGGCIDKVSIL